MQKRKITIITIILLSIGIFSGLSILSQYFTNTHVISKEQAMSIVMKSGHWTQQELDNSTIDAKLLQAKLSNNVALVIDPITMSPEPYPTSLRTFYFHENQLFWQIIIKQYPNGVTSHPTFFEIDATNGTLIESR